MERRQRPGLRSRAPMSELPWPRPLHTHIPPLATRGAASRETSRGRGSGLRSAAPHTRGGGGAGGGGAGAGEAQGGRGGGKRRPAAGGGGAADAEARDARGGRRLRAAAGLGALEARPARGDPESPMKCPRGRGRGAVLGRLSGGPRHPWLSGGRGGALGVSRGRGAGAPARGGGGVG